MGQVVGRRFGAVSAGRSHDRAPERLLLGPLEMATALERAAYIASGRPPGGRITGLDTAAAALE